MWCVFSRFLDDAVYVGNYHECVRECNNLNIKYITNEFNVRQWFK